MKSPRIKVSIVMLLLLIGISGCKAQNLNKEMITTGYISAEELKNDDKYPWFNSGYNKYQPDEQIISKLNQVEKNFSIVIFAGEWCGDTHYLLPKYFKTCDLAGIINQQIYLLDRNKKSYDRLEEKHGITVVPTFIVLRNGEETGRIEERVNESIERDLLKLLDTE